MTQILCCFSLSHKHILLHGKRFKIQCVWHRCCLGDYLTRMSTLRTCSLPVHDQDFKRPCDWRTELCYNHSDSTLYPITHQHGTRVSRVEKDVILAVRKLYKARII